MLPLWVSRSHARTSQSGTPALSDRWSVNHHLCRTEPLRLTLNNFLLSFRWAFFPRSADHHTTCYLRQSDTDTRLEQASPSFSKRRFCPHLITVRQEPIHWNRPLNKLPAHRARQVETLYVFPRALPHHIRSAMAKLVCAVVWKDDIYLPWWAQ